MRSLWAWLAKSFVWGARLFSVMDTNPPIVNGMLQALLLPLLL